MDRNFRDEDEPRQGGNRGLREAAGDAVGMIADAGLEALQRKLNTRLYDIQSLQVDPEQGGGLFGFGKRVVVPADEVHVVSGHGIHSSPIAMKKATEVFGQAAKKTSVYWRNALTEVIALRTITFVIPVAGANSIGVDVLDKNRIPYNVTAHVVAKLDETQPEIAAQSVGNDIMGLAANIREVTEAQLLDAAAEMTLEEVLNDRQQLADKARDEVNATLTGLGYKLLYITIAELGGVAYEKLVEQAQATVTRDTTIQINAAQLKTHESNQEKARTTAEVDGLTRKETQEKSLAADKAVKSAELDKDETVAERENALALANEQRSLRLETAKNEVSLQKVGLQKAEQLATTTAQADVALLDQERQKAILQAGALADAERDDLVQERDLTRSAKKTKEDAARLLEEQESTADRNKVVTVTTAEAKAEALKIETTAQNQVRLSKAQTEAQASEQEAAAKVKMADATRAEAAAPGLAEADVDERRVAIAEKQVAVDRASGVARAEVAQLEADAEIHRQGGLMEIQLKLAREQAELFTTNPALFELEKMKLQLGHDLQVKQAELSAQVQIATAMAEHMNISANIIGDGSRASAIMSQMMSIAAGAQVVGEQVPFIGNMLNGASNGNGTASAVSTTKSLSELLAGVAPFIQSLVKEMNPKIFSTLTVEALMEALVPVVSGQKDLVSALQQIKDDANFRVIADMPVAPILKKIGLSPEKSDDAVAA
ncbi:MAG: SPFH domain-containing protein [Syntrophales bacterium]|jgi:hypothetical protein|nr:SPFH domain-containing protein [Syntrophales bacterium]